MRRLLAASGPQGRGTPTCYPVLVPCPSRGSWLWGSSLLSHGLWGGRHGPGDPRLSSGPRVEEDREEGMLGRILSPKDTHVLLPVKVVLHMAKGTLQVWSG